MSEKKQEKREAHLRAVCGERHERVLSVAREHINEERRTVELAFSSELPYERWWGIEILDHSAESVRMDRLAQRDHRGHREKTAPIPRHYRSCWRTKTVNRQAP